MDEALADLADHNLNIEVLVGVADTGNRLYGVRCRPYGRGKDKDTMVLGGGTTLAEAVADVHTKAKAGRFERLDYAKRPWKTAGLPTAWGPNESPTFLTERRERA